MSARADVAVLGGGPAGAAAALGLACLGYQVTVVSLERSATVEGLSARTIARLEAAGLRSAVATASAPAPRMVCWGEDRGQRGEERIVSRDQFDQALRTDVQVAGVRWINTAASAVRGEESGWVVETGEGTVRCRAVLDARGRRARRHERRGPHLVSWGACVECDRRDTDSPVSSASPAAAVVTQAPGVNLLAPATGVVALDDGWCWIARREAGRAWIQFVGDATEQLSAQDLGNRFKLALEKLPELGVLPGMHALAEMGAQPTPPSNPSALAARRFYVSPARAAVARYSAPAQAAGYLRIGDAAVAMDPLSGNGIYEALGSAQVAVAAINTWLTGGSWPQIARFLDERAAELWRRCVTAAGSFYRQQAERTSRPFWQQTASAYEHLALEAQTTEKGPGRFELRPVLNRQRIEVRRVWVSPAWPRGMWMPAPAVLQQEV